MARTRDDRLPDGLLQLVDEARGASPKRRAANNHGVGRCNINIADQLLDLGLWHLDRIGRGAAGRGEPMLERMAH